MILETFYKQPSEVKDYDVDYTPWLTRTGDTIDSVDTAVLCVTDPTDTSLEVFLTQNTLTVAKLWVRGGNTARRYKVTIQMTTNGGRVDENELMFNVKDS